jgi:hypothetical protein
VSPEDFHLFRVTDDVEEAVSEIRRFYANYHSSRYVGELLVLRLRHAPPEEEIEKLNEEFGDILEQGRIEVTRPLAREEGEVPDFPRVTLRFNRRRVGRLRLLIDRLNALAPSPASPLEASPHEIVASDVPREAARAEED